MKWHKNTTHQQRERERETNDANWVTRESITTTSYSRTLFSRQSLPIITMHINMVYCRINRWYERTISGLYTILDDLPPPPPSNMNTAGRPHPSGNCMMHPLATAIWRWPLLLLLLCVYKNVVPDEKRQHPPLPPYKSFRVQSSSQTLLYDLLYSKRVLQWPATADKIMPWSKASIATTFEGFYTSKKRGAILAYAPRDVIIGRLFFPARQHHYVSRLYGRRNTHKIVTFFHALNLVMAFATAVAWTVRAETRRYRLTDDDMASPTRFDRPQK